MPDSPTDGTSLGRQEASTAPPKATPSPAAAIGSRETVTAVETADASQSSAGYLAAAPAAPSQIKNPDRYEIIAEHGRGGLGRVSRARDLELDRDVAIKELLNRTISSEARFAQEARITARLEHPNIVPVHEAGRWPDGTPFYAMKLVAGRPLRELISERTTVESRLELLDHVIAVADAIAYAHTQGIIHRDLKPANVIVGDFGETIVIDWGLAKDLRAQATECHDSASDNRAHQPPHLTRTGAPIGTPAYMAPEQERGDRVDQRADVFAIGAMLWELCSLSRVPPANLDIREKVLRFANIDQDLIVILEKALARDPKARYPDAGELAADLRAFKSGYRISSRQYSLTAILSHWSRRHRTATWSIALGAVTIALLAWTYLHNIAEERDRARLAELVATMQTRVAATQRDRAQLSEASLLLETDPTQAFELLQRDSAHSPASALLMSRARRQAALASYTTHEGIRDIIRPWNSPAIYIQSTTGNLYTVSTLAAPEQYVDRTTLGGIALSESGLSYLRQVQPDAAEIVQVRGTPTQALKISSRFADTENRLLAAGRHYYILHKNALFDTSNPLQPVRTDIEAALPYNNGILLCLTDGRVSTLNVSVETSAARCAPGVRQAAIAASSNGMVTSHAEGGLLVNYGGRSQVVAAPHMRAPMYALSAGGDVGIADLQGYAWYARNGSNAVIPVPFSISRPSAVAGDGPFLAWGAFDGTIAALDTSSGRTKFMRGRFGQVRKIDIDSQRQLLYSASNSLLRVWSLRKDAIDAGMHRGCRIFHAIPSNDGRLLAYDCDDGTLGIYSHGDHRTVATYKHNKTTYGVGWLRDRACGGSLDGRVTCILPDGNSETIYHGQQSIRWLTSDAAQRSIAFAEDSGAVYIHDGRLRRVYEHRGHPYRLAFNQNGSLLASCDREGGLVVYDIDRQRTIAQLQAHSGMLTTLEWQGTDLFTAGGDGWIRHWTVSNGQLALAPDAVHVLGTARALRVFANGLVASSNDTSLTLLSKGYTFNLELGNRIQRIEISTDQRYILAVIQDELVVLDILNEMVASFDDSVDAPAFAGFGSNDSILYTSNHSLKSVELKHLSFIRYQTQPSGTLQ